MSAPRSSLAGAAGQVAALARTNALDLTRQPVYGVVLAAGLALVATSPMFAVFSLGRAEALVLDLGASAMLFACVFLAAAAAAGGAAEKVEDGTAALVLTHPVSALTWCAGSLLGGLVALAQGALLLGLTLQWASENGPDRLHLGVALPGLAALAGALAWGLRASLARRAFQPAALAAATALFPLAHVASRFLGPDGALRAAAHLAEPVALAAALLALLAAAPFAALGLALATRLGPGGAAGATLAAFLAASVARPLAASFELLAPLAALLPDLQLFWVADAAYGGATVPPGYVGEVALYAALYTLFALALAAALLEGRELGR